MRIAELLNESKEVTSITPEVLMGAALRTAKSAAEAIIIIHDAVKHPRFDPEDLEALVKSLRKYSTFTFVSETVNFIQDTLHSYAKMQQAKSLGKEVTAKLKLHSSALLQALIAGDKETSRAHAAELNTHVDSLDHRVDVSQEVKRHLKYKYVAEPSIFGTTQLLDELGDEQYNLIRKLDFSKTLYTTIEFPKTKADDVHFVIYFLTQLSTSPKPRRIKDAGEFRTHTRVALAGSEEMQDLLKHISNYIHSNDKALIPELKRLVEKIPFVKAANDRAKKKIKLVYRGLGFGEDEHISDKQILAGELKRNFVATSTSKYAAKKFALQIGHLESDDGRRSEDGVIITYGVKPEAIVLDTSVVDTAYNESEIIVDARKATIIEIERI